MENIANKLKNSEITLDEKASYALLEDISKGITEGSRVPRSSIEFNDKGQSVFEEFVNVFLQSHAAITSSDGTAVPTYDPFYVGYCTSEDPDLGERRHWIGYYSNCQLMYTEFVNDARYNQLMIVIDRDLYETAVQLAEDTIDG